MMVLSPQSEQDKIYSVQLKIEETGAQWTADKTQFSHLTTEEKRAISGARVGPLVPGIPIVSAPVVIQADDDYPAKFDWRAVDGHDWMTPVRTQGNCGCCWAFSTVDTLEAVYNIRTGNPNLNLNLSEQHLVSDCCPTESCGDCGGGYPDWAFEYIRSNGISTEACYPYIVQNSPCNPCNNWKDDAAWITGFVYINPTRDSFKWALMEYGPLAVVMQNPEDWFLYTSGVYSPTDITPQADIFDHCVVLVGWDDDLDAWIIKNNKGTGFGYDGYGYIKFGVLEGKNYAYAVTGIPGYGVSWIKPVSVVASSSDNDFIPEYTIDGLLNTFWMSAHRETDATLTFDLGENIAIDSTHIKLLSWVTAFDPAKINIAVSTDGNTWNTVVSDFTVEIDEQRVVIPFTTVNAKYIRIGIYTYDTRPAVYEFDVRQSSVTPNINIASFTVDPLTCVESCNVAVNIQWENTGQEPITFTKGFTVDGVLHSDSTVTLLTGETTNLFAGVYLPDIGKYEICTYTEVV